MLTQVKWEKGDESSGELRLREPLLMLLERRRWIRPDTLIIDELPWHGRRVDLVTRTRSGIIVSYELKIGSFSRALEQAIYNRLSFDRSYMVVASMPRPENREMAAFHNVGIILIADFSAACILRSPHTHADPVLRQRLDEKVVSLGGRNV